MSLKHAAEYLADPSSAILVGAGASAEGGLPTWSGLVEAIKTVAPAPFRSAIEALVEQRKYAEAIQVGRIAIGDPHKWNSLFEAFDTSGVTTNVWKLISALGISKIVTTNYDHIGEDSFANVWGRSAASYVGVDRILQPLRKTAPHFVYPHGKAPQWSTLVLSQSDYDAVETDDRYREFWIDLLTKRPLLVVGFSGDDPALQRVLSWVDQKLGILHLVKPVVLLPQGRKAAFGPSTSVLEYDPVDNHRLLRELLRDLRDELGRAFLARGVSQDPYVRVGVPRELPRRELLLALAGVNFRDECSPETFVALTVVIGALIKGVPVDKENLSAVVVKLTSTSRGTAGEAIDHAFDVAESYGWARQLDGRFVATQQTPQPRTEDLSNLLAAVRARAQHPIAWVSNERYDKYAQDAILSYLTSESSVVASPLLGLEEARSITAPGLRSSLSLAGLSIGAAHIETQICHSVISIFNAPPPGLEAICGRIASFAFALSLTANARGRELLDSLSSVETIYFDANVVIPALAEGHHWHRLCRLLVERARSASRNRILQVGFVEEVTLQFKDAETLVGSASAVDAFKLASAYGAPNGFLDGYRGYCEANGVIAFSTYAAAIGMGRGSLTDALRGLEIEVWREPKKFGKFEELRSRLVANLTSGGRHVRLAQHEADQLATLAVDNEGRRNQPSKFVTAHKTLREMLARNYPMLVGAAVPPVALLSLFDALKPRPIPSSSLRELAFSEAGIEVAERVFGILLREFADKTESLLAEDLFDAIRTQISGLIGRFENARGADLRVRLVKVVEEEVLPAMREKIDAGKLSKTLVTTPPRQEETSSQAAKRIVEETGLGLKS